MELLKPTPSPLIDQWTKRKSCMNRFLESRLAVKLIDQVHLVDLDDIKYLSSDSNYTWINRLSSNALLASKTLKYYERLLVNKGFLRVHAGYIVNLNHVIGIEKTDGFGLALGTGEVIPVSRTFKKQLFSEM